MSDVNALPHLIALLEDESVVVQSELQRAFCSLYESLSKELAKLEPLSPEQQERLHGCLEPARRKRLLDHWSQRPEETTPQATLEFGLDCIARYQNGLLHSESVESLLTETVVEFRNSYPQADGPLELAHYLFDEPGLKGERANYYSPLNSNLVHVLKTGTGNPISLTCIFILMAARLGFDVKGCNYPGHFLARVNHREKISFVDCFSGGQVLDEQLTKLLRSRTSVATRMSALQESASTKTILCRVLRNLIHGYRVSEEGSQADLFLFILKATRTNLDTRCEQPLFSPGQLVKHNQYPYRGVVVDYDLQCTADDDWYYSNQSQPRKDQPWYRVLVDGTNKITYAAQTSLGPDDLKKEIQHPLAAAFFSGFELDSYTRNERPWPEVD